MTILKVSSTSNPNSLATAIVANIQAEGSVKLQAIGAGAVNQAAKGIAIAREFCSQTNFDFICVPSFHVLILDEKECTALRFTVSPVRRKRPKWDTDSTRLEHTA